MPEPDSGLLHGGEHSVETRLSTLKHAFETSKVVTENLFPPKS